MNSSRNPTPRPVAAQPPSPARGEGDPVPRREGGPVRVDVQEAVSNSPTDAVTPSPLAGEGAPTGRVAPEGRLRAGEGSLPATPAQVKGQAVSIKNHPSSGPSDHLLPQGEKGRGADTVGHRTGDLAPERVPITDLPSPLAGEGARRAGEGSIARNREIESPPRLRRFAKTLRHHQTEHELRLWGMLRNRRFAAFKFRRQVPIGPYVADFVCYEARLIVELDGSQHADSAHDKVRDQWLVADGYRVLRIWNGELLTQRDSVLEAIWYALNQAPSSGPSDHLLPQGEKGRGDRTADDVAGATDAAGSPELPSPLAGEGGALAPGEGAGEGS